MSYHLEVDFCLFADNFRPPYVFAVAMSDFYLVVEREEILYSLLIPNLGFFRIALIGKRARGRKRLEGYSSSACLIFKFFLSPFYDFDKGRIEWE